MTYLDIRPINLGSDVGVTLPQHGYLLAELCQLVVQYHIVLDGVIELLFGLGRVCTTVLPNHTDLHQLLVLDFEPAHL